MIKRAYWQGFSDECRRRGVDPRALVKFAQQMSAVPGGPSGSTTNAPNYQMKFDPKTDMFPLTDEQGWNSSNLPRRFWEDKELDLARTGRMNRFIDSVFPGQGQGEREDSLLGATQLGPFKNQFSKGVSVPTFAPEMGYYPVSGMDEVDGWNPYTRQFKNGGGIHQYHLQESLQVDPEIIDQYQEYRYHLTPAQALEQMRSEGVSEDVIQRLKQQIQMGLIVAQNRRFSGNTANV